MKCANPETLTHNEVFTSSNQICVTIFIVGRKNEKIRINRCIADDSLSMWNYTVQYLLSKDLHSQYHRMKELELSHKTLLVMTDQLNVKVHKVENANVRVKEKLRVIWEELMNLVRRILFQMT